MSNPYDVAGSFSNGLSVGESFGALRDKIAGRKATNDLEQQRIDLEKSRQDSDTFEKTGMTADAIRRYQSPGQSTPEEVDAMDNLRQKMKTRSDLENKVLGAKAAQEQATADWLKRRYSGPPGSAANGNLKAVVSANAQFEKDRQVDPDGSKGIYDQAAHMANQQRFQELSGSQVTKPPAPPPATGWAAVKGAMGDLYNKYLGSAQGPAARTPDNYSSDAIDAAIARKNAGQ